MLSSLKNIFKVEDLRNKVLFTLMVIVLYRIGAHIPVPGVDFEAIRSLKQSAQQGGTIAFLNLFSGGALTQFAIFALGIMPYITASIIIQILGVVIPKLEEWQEQGAVGQRKITQWTRYLGIAIALLQATGLTFLFGRGGTGAQRFLGPQAPNIKLLPDFSLGRVLLVILTLTAGVALIMWMGELITQRGIGNGMSILIFASVVSGLPASYAAIRASNGSVVLSVLLLMSLVSLVGIVFVEQGQRRIPVQFAKRVVGRRMYGGQSTYVPLKVNMAGVIPIIFASSVLYLPAMLTNVVHWQWLQDFVNNYILDTNNWLHLVFFGFLIIGFAYFYTAIAFDPIKQADQIRKQGGFIPGIRPGPQTERYLARILNRITLPGAVFVAAIALVPSIIAAGMNVQNYPLGGTTVLIAVGVALETMKQIDSQLMMRNYEGFLK
ncbi:MAG: preprotein translocase subunit SecY [Acidimicrobiia bacterium]